VAAWAYSAPADADRSALIAAARRLVTRPSFTTTAVELLAVVTRLETLDELADICAGRPVLALRAQQRVRNYVGRSAEPALLRAALIVRTPKVWAPVGGGC
jgi:hypothetical protein